MEKAAKTDPKIKKRVDQYLMGYPMAYYDLANDPDQRDNADPPARAPGRDQAAAGHPDELHGHDQGPAVGQL